MFLELSKLSRLNWTVLIIGLLFALVLPLGVHMLMLNVNGVPSPSSAGVPKVVLWMNNALSSLAVLFAVTYARWSLKRLPLWLRCLCASLVIAALKETFRGIFMNGFVTTAYTFNFLVALPFILCRVSLYAGITLIAELSIHRLSKVCLALILFTGAFLAEPWIEKMLDLETLFSHLAHAEVYSVPYGWEVEVTSMVSFIEPVLAIFIAYLLMLERLGSTRKSRVVKFCLLILVVRMNLFCFLVYGIFSKQGYQGYMLASSQFVLEWISLAVIAALAIEWSHLDSALAGHGRPVFGNA